MNPGLAKKTVPPEATPAGLKWTLLILLFASSIAGFSSGWFLLKKSAGLSPASLGQPFDSGAANFIDFSERADSVRQNFSGGEAIVCQGTIIRENGAALAMINGQTAAVGSTVSGVRILEVTASNVLIECNSETRRLSPGESFIPGKKL